MSVNLTTGQRLDLIRAHTVHTQTHSPDSVHVHDKLYLLKVIARLERELDDTLYPGYARRLLDEWPWEIP